MHGTDGLRGVSVTSDLSEIDASGSTGQRRTCLSHDLPCPACGHARHTFLACSDTCACVPPPLPGVPDVAAARRLELTA